MRHLFRKRCIRGSRRAWTSTRRSAGIVRAPQPRRRFQPSRRSADVVEPRGAREPRLLRTHAQRAPGQRRGAVGQERREDRLHPRVGEGRHPRPRRQAVDLEVRGSAQARGGAGRGRREEGCRLRHDDRAVRDHDRAATRARQRSRDLRRDSSWVPSRDRPSTWRACTT